MTEISSSSRKAQFQVVISKISSNKLQHLRTFRIPKPMSRQFLILNENDTEFNFTFYAVTGPIIADDFANILSSEEYSDVTLVAQGGVTFKAHKVILCARSEVFAAMFRNDSEESRKNCIEIKDMDASVMKEMLTNIYTDSEIPKEMAAKLFSAANKYALFNLQKICEEKLINEIDEDCVVDTLMLAEQHSSERLRNEAIDFFIHNIKAVNDTESWKILQESYHELYVEILEKTIEELL
ncbi:speckle-type POZ protein-like [Musca autumnalis]|uniref:speckle-type POZ protein-like n=1 Tax=Musca autumnalis TaxID=221902 RepID=UPI003CF4F8D3